MGLVYVISAGPMMHKVGRTENVEARLKTLQTAHGRKLELVGAVHVMDSRIVEKGAHAELAAHRTLGEWFAVTAEQAIDAIHKASVLPPEHTFFARNLVCCVKEAPSGLLQVGRIYTVKRAYIGGYVELLEVEAPGFIWSPHLFVSLVGIESVRREVDPGDVV